MEVLLACRWPAPGRRAGVLLDPRFFLLAGRLSGDLDDACVNNLAAAYMYPWHKLAVDGLKHARARTSLNQPFLEGPERRAIRDLAEIDKGSGGIKSSLRERVCPCFDARASARHIEEIITR